MCLQKSRRKKRPAARKIGKLKGNVLVQTRQSIYSCLKANNHDPKTLSYKRQAPYILDEQSGVSLALLFQAVQPLSKSEKISNISNGITAMSNEEAHYWFAKVSNGKRRAALKAIRVLLGE